VHHAEHPTSLLADVTAATHPWYHIDMRTPRKTVLTLVTLAVSVSCIERPEQPHTQPIAPQERAHVQDVLVNGNPAPKHLVGATFDPIELVGYDATPEPATRGERVKVTVYYRALEDITDDWEVFVHAEDQAKQQQRFNVDHYPANGKLHTNQWHKGDVIRDEYFLVVPSSVSALELWTGFFMDNDRLKITNQGRGLNDGTDRLRIGVISAR
jgi:hypothetical protein